jgi:hypothetical protein
MTANSATALQATSNMYELRRFVGVQQLHALRAGVYGEESPFFVAKLAELVDRVKTMPKTYEQDGMGDEAIAHLHYFRGGMDFYITERDREEGPQLQAFGLADLGYGGELGYISIADIIAHGVELDLYFQPTTLANIKAKRK